LIEQFSSSSCELFVRSFDHQEREKERKREREREREREKREGRREKREGRREKREGRREKGEEIERREKERKGKREREKRKRERETLKGRSTKEKDGGAVRVWISLAGEGKGIVEDEEIVMKERNEMLIKKGDNRCSKDDVAVKIHHKRVLLTSFPLRRLDETKELRLKVLCLEAVCRKRMLVVTVKGGVGREERRML